MHKVHLFDVFKQLAANEKKTLCFIKYECKNVVFFSAFILIDMHPVGNIIRKEGETIEINCTLDSPDYNINDLKFSFQERGVKPDIIVSKNKNICLSIYLFIFT